MNDFSRVVCGLPEVRAAFAETGLVTRLWWQVVLWLHGKPTAREWTEGEQTRCVANGFAFYAALYRALAVLLWGTGAALLWAREMAPDVVTLYGPFAAFAAGVYLFVVASIGARAAWQYVSDPAKATLTLATFIALLVAFLSLLLGGASAALHAVTGVPPVINVCVTFLVFVFGVGSYLIELVYAVAALSFITGSCSNDNKEKDTGRKSCC